MNWRFWQSERDQVIGDVRKELHYMSKTINAEYEDASIMELLDEMESLRHSFDRLLEPETATPAAPGAPLIPPELLDAALQAVPEGWRGIASIAARRILNDPKRLGEIMEKLKPVLEKAQGQLPTTPATAATGNHGLLQQAGIPPEYYQGYDPAHPPPRKWPGQ